MARLTFAADPTADLETVVSSFGCWLDEHRGDVAALVGPRGGDVADALAQTRPALRALYEGGWTRLGWPVSVGGIGGSAIQRASVFEALSAAGYTWSIGAAIISEGAFPRTPQLTDGTQG